MNSLSLDDQLKLALACGYEDARIAIDVDNNVNKDRHSFVVVDKVNVFQHTSPDTLMRLMFNLKIDVEWVELDEVGRGAMQCQVYRRLTLKRFLKHCRTPEEIADAILECSMAVINE